MANQERGEVGIDVDGRRYTFRPTLNAICSLEELTGKSIDEITTAAEKGRRLSAVRQLIWAYLQECHGDEIRTLEDAGRWMQRAGGLPALHDKLSTAGALNAAPEVATEAGPRNGARGRPPKAQAGGRSTSPPDGPA